MNSRSKLFVENIKCGGCQKTITQSMQALGLQNVVVDPGEGSVEFDSTTDAEISKKALEKLRSLGYPLIDTEEGLKAAALKAKSYISCAIGRFG